MQVSSRLLVLQVAFCILLGALLFLVFYNFTADNIFFANDQATDFIVAREWLSGDMPLLGPPSHVGGRHPGPIYYGFVTLLYFLAGKNITVAIALAALCKVLSVGLLFCAFRELLPKSSSTQIIFAMIGAALCIMQPPYVWLFRVGWHSNFLFIAGLIAASSCLPVLRHGPSRLPVAALGLSFLFLTHLSSVPVVGAFALIIACRFFTNRGRWSTGPANKSLLYASFVGVLILWSPVIYHELNFPQNFAALFNLHSSHQLKAGILKSISMAVNFLAYNCTGLPKDSISFASKLVFIVISGFFACRFFKERDPVGRWQCALIFAPIISTIFVLARFKEPLYSHYFNSSIFIPAFLSGLIFWQAAHEAFTSATPIRKYAGILFITCFTTVALFGGFRSFRTFRSPRFDSFYTLAHFETAASDMQKIVGETNEPITVITSLKSKVSRNGYAYFLPLNYHLNLEYENFFHELDYFAANHSVAQRGIFIACPPPHAELRNRLVENLQGWKASRPITDPTCETCGECLIMKLDRG